MGALAGGGGLGGGYILVSHLAWWGSVNPKGELYCSPLADSYREERAGNRTGCRKNKITLSEKDKMRFGHRYI